jgi:hypothetical protein
VRLLTPCLIACALVANVVAQDPPLTLTAAPRDGRVYLGGGVPEAAWRNAESLVVPIETEIIRHPPLEVTLRALVDDERLYLRIEWPDEEADTAYRPYRHTGAGWGRTRDVDDGVVLRWRGELSEVVDRWDWSAHLTNCVGHAVDTVDEGVAEGITGSWLANSDGTDAAPLQVWRRSEMEGPLLPDEHVVRSADHLFEGHTEPLGEANPLTGDPWKEGDTVPSVINRFPTGGQADVEAVGTWEEKRWTLETRRRLDTGDAEHDLAFAEGESFSLEISFRNAQPEIAPIQALLILP